MSGRVGLRRAPLRASMKAVLRSLLRGADDESAVPVAVVGVLPTGMLVTQSGAPLGVE